jgi:hypothetical protein
MSREIWNWEGFENKTDLAFSARQAKKGTHKKEGRLRPEIILGRID